MENFKTYSKIPFEGESVGYTVKSMEKDFPISNYPLEQTEFLYDSKQGKVTQSDSSARTLGGKELNFGSSALIFHILTRITIWSVNSDNHLNAFTGP